MERLNLPKDFKFGVFIFFFNIFRFFLFLFLQEEFKIFPLFIHRF